MKLAKGTAMTKPTRSQISQSFGKLDDIVKQAMDRTGVPGISVAVVFDDQVLYQEGYGVRSTETRASVRPETVPLDSMMITPDLWHSLKKPPFS